MIFKDLDNDGKEELIVFGKDKVFYYFIDESEEILKPLILIELMFTYDGTWKK